MNRFKYSSSFEFKYQVFLYPTNHESGLSDFEDPSNLINYRMKRDVNYEDEDAMDDTNPWLDNGNAIDVGKRAGGKSVFNYLDVTLFIFDTAY